MCQSSSSWTAPGLHLVPPMAIMVVLEAGHGRRSLGSRSLALPQQTVMEHTGDRLATLRGGVEVVVLVENS